MKTLLYCLPALLLVAGLSPPSPSFISEGSEIPRFNLNATKGTIFKSESLAGKIGVIVFLRPGQESSVKLLQELERSVKKLGDSSWQRIVICAGDVTQEAIRDLVRKAGYSGTILLDPRRRAYSSFGVVAVPSLAVFDSHSKIVYSRPGYGVNVSSELTRHLGKLLGKSAKPDAVDVELYRSTPQVELARRLVRKGDLPKAVELLREAEARESAPLEAYLLFADVLVRQGKPKKALRHVKNAAAKFGETFRSQIGLARVLLALEQTEDAGAILLEVARNVPDSWEAHYALGELHEKEGKKDEAIRELKRAITLLR